MDLAKNQRGAMNVLLIPLILLIVMFLGALGFGFWAFMGMQDYKNNVDEKVVAAVEVAKKETATKKDNEFTEREKEPHKTYQGPSAQGSILIKYPKTWSGYVDEGRSGSAVDGYFHPSTVPGTQSGVAYALRVQVTNRGFHDEVKSLDSAVRAGRARSSAYQPAKVDGVVGVRIDGEIRSGQQGIMVILPLRDKTIKLFTESDQFHGDFNNHILPNLSFTP